MCRPCMTFNGPGRSWSSHFGRVVGCLTLPGSGFTGPSPTSLTGGMLQKECVSRFHLKKTGFVRNTANLWSSSAILNRCLCVSPVMDHKFHPVVPIREEHEEKMKQLWKIQSEVQQTIRDREQLIYEIYSTVSTENQAESLIAELAEEITLLTSECSEMMQVSQTEDPLHFLQAFRIPENLLHFRDWTTVEVCPQPDVQTVSRGQDQLEETLNVRTENPRDLKAALEKCECLFRLIHHNTPGPIYVYINIFICIYLYAY